MIGSLYILELYKYTSAFSLALASTDKFSKISKSVKSYSAFIIGQNKENKIRIKNVNSNNLYGLCYNFEI